jgi:hypothetical protein
VRIIYKKGELNMNGKNKITETEELMARTLKEKSASILKKLLEKSVLFRDFSPRNSILIALQCPGATMVMGKKSWEHFGVKPRSEKDCITITGIKREVRGDAREKNRWLEQNPFRKIEGGIIPSRLRSLQNGNRPTKEELEFASSKIPGFAKMYNDWVKSMPKDVRFTNLFIPVKVYDVSQCEIVDEEKYRNIPRPKMDIRLSGTTLPVIENMLAEKGFVIDGSTPVSVGKAVGNVILIDGEADEKERLFQLVQAWADTKTKDMQESVMAGAMLMLYCGLSDSVPDSVLETIFLKVKTSRELSMAITKAGKVFREMAEELEETIEKNMEKEKEEKIDEMELEIY